MGKKKKTPIEIRRLGGRARAKSLTPEQRREIARLGGLAKQRNLRKKRKGVQK